MDDSFSLGQQPKKRRGRVTAPPRHAAPRTHSTTVLRLAAIRARPSHARKSSLDQTRLILGIVALLVAGLLVWGFTHFMARSGQEAAAQEGEAVDRAQDVQAQLTGSSVIQAVNVLYAAKGSFEEVTPGSLEAAEPAFTYIDGVSTDANTVSVKSSPQGVGLAIRSSSGSCLYAHIAAAGVTYGSGPACTGEAAMEAYKPSWPTPA